MSEESSNIICRVCLQCDVKESKKCLSVFETYNGSSISEKVNYLAEIDIKEGDGLPDKICPDCLLQLESSVAFKTKCKTSDRFLRCKVLLGQQALPKVNESSIEINKTIKEEASEKHTIEISIEQDELFYYNTEESLADISQPLEDTSESAVENLPNNSEPSEVKLEFPVRPSRATDLKLICDDCGGSFKSKCKLRVHWKNVHQPEKLICPICKRMFKSYRAFNLHKKKKTKACTAALKARVEGQGKSRIFHCNECNYKSKRLKDMDSHYVTHTGERPFQCKLCPKTFTQQSSLQEHMERTHHVYMVETTCHLCGKHILGRGKLYQHMRIHSAKRFQCHICYKLLKNKDSLANHMLRHSGVKSYSCEVCAASFYTPCEVYNHRTKVHLKKKNFKCDLCDYTMYTKVALKKHRAKHTGTNVVCLVCGTFCENAEKLLKHQRVHFNRHIECPHCDKKFHNRHALSKHICKNHRCTLLVEKKEELKLSSNSDIKEESPTNKVEVEILSPSNVISK
ncbi:uncharacterized protein LOC142984932 [Anticarsia gemmatalis]|uniref:uncharacterized protein LOC142984932 n=1 Tax=Anticarsia gemmatalis TaxID=129554 RepID=UPI003F774573